MKTVAIRAMPAPAESYWGRLNATPLADVLRGRLSASLDARRIIAAANLAEPLSGFVYKTVRRTRLWRSERVDVARELAGHFRDGLDAGRTPEQLLKSFGDPRQAARLIRRAKLRGRPLGWRVWRRAVQAAKILFCLLVVSYAVLFIRLLTAHATISHNYALELTAASRTVPERERAWPLYREALLRITDVPRIKLLPGAPPTTEKDGDRVFLYGEKPGSLHWNQIVTWLNENRGVVELCRQAASRPQFGFVFDDPADLPWLKKDNTDPKFMDLERNSELIGLIMPQDSATRDLMALLQVDARQAAAENDQVTFVRDVKALLGLASQLHADMPLLLIDLVSINRLTAALDVVDETIAGHPNFLRDADLQGLAHCIAGFGDGEPIRCRLTGERIVLRDIIQRLYTDDGHGDGRLTHDGMGLVFTHPILPRDGSGWILFEKWTGKSPEWTLGPAVLAFSPSRRAMTDLAEKMYDRVEQQINTPYWQWTTKSINEDLKRVEKSPVDRIRYALLVVFKPVLSTCASPGERITQRRDATLVAIALTIYHRRHEAWPTKLSELVPDLLPAVPPDRFTGRELLYRVIDGKPLLYSAGPDRKDDGGRSVLKLDDIRFEPPSDEAPKHEVPTGDWILWPPQPEKPDAE